MTREEAVSAIISTWYQRDGEYCCSSSERQESRQELAEVLSTLGVTKEEIDEWV